MNDHVAKPIDIKALFSVLSQYIESKPERALKAPVTSKAKETAPSTEMPLPDSLPGISIKTGLSRGNNKESLYRKILKKFYTEYENTAAEIIDALQAGDVELARRLAHTVKGVAGNIGAQDLQKIAGKLETAIKDEDPEGVGNALEGFEPVLNAARDALQPYVTGAVDNPQGGADEATCEPGDLCKLQEMLQALQPMVTKRKPKPSKALIEEINTFAWPAEYQAKLAELTQLVGKYKFKEADTLTKELIAKM